MPVATPCPWASHSPLLQAFHDHEWGEPMAKADILFEYLVLHTFQLGFDFPVALKRREVFRELLAGFNADRLARFDENNIAELLLNPRTLRNRKKLEATVQNARAWQQLRRDVGGDEFILPFFYACVSGRPLDARRSPHNPVPAATPAGEALSKELKRRGFTMTAPITCHNIMQTAGLVNDHLLGCPRHAECHRLARD